MLRNTAFRNVLVLVAGALSCAPVYAGVMKWTDADGQVHYGDSAPPGVSASQVYVSPARPGRPAVPPRPLATPPSPAPARQLTVAEEREAAAEEGRRRNVEGLAALGQVARDTAARNDQEVVARCKAARNTYCNGGAEEVRKQNYNNELAQQAAQSEAAVRQGRAVPESQRIRPTSPCEWPRTCDRK